VITTELKHLNQIRAHGERGYPDECCGLLLGKITEMGKIILEVRETENNWSADGAEYFQMSGSKRNRFTIAPEEMLKVVKEAREKCLEIVGVYHSHPDYRAVPSEFDRAIAWPEYSYIIVSVENGRAGELLSWTLDLDHQFLAEKILTDCKD